MRKIILASRSKARRKLLKSAGFKFKVVESRARESRILKRRTSDLVIGNALRKAKSVAARFDSGIVIGADTVVLAGKKIIGKPKNIKDAFTHLKLLAGRPQWVYTGLAVIDIDNNKIFTAHDKTKVYMRALSDEQIKNYFKRVSPLEKAGSFDVQGPDRRMFIDRIKGSFDNVVGLPIKKLAKILKKIDPDFR
ncbi:MAG: septum formation protein Maf [Omnitrophica bacterium RIFCSPLOWO2_01_FULL_45_10]|nr:MAG: septum formation protein Maf [Omnitrophica bacterium RIFCSPLOWO2_01_FULL_45_10]